jgi:hypothetical protein
MAIGALSPQAQASQDHLVEKLPTAFFVMAKQDAPLAIALHAQVDLIEDGDFIAALKLNRAIATRLELLAVTQGD